MASYLRPTALAEALAALADRPRTLLAGGTDHFPARLLAQPDEDILDLTGLPGLRAIAPDGPFWRIPCLATWTDLLEAPLPPAFDGLRLAARQIGGRQVQNAGTIVGNLCNASPAADGIPCLLALDAQVEIASLRGRSALPVADFVVGSRRTARRSDELVTAVLVPRPGPGWPAAAFHKLGARNRLVISIAMVAAVAEFTPDGRIAVARIAVGACTAVATRLPALEAALVGRTPDPALARPEHLAPLAPIDDVRGTASYRRAAALELVRRAVVDLASPYRAAA